MVSNSSDAAAYQLAQSAIASLKTAIYMLLVKAPEAGMKNVDIGRRLGVYHGHVKHVGHIPRTMLAIMEEEGVVHQDAETKCWKLGTLANDADE